MSQLDRRFQIAYDKARTDWSQADLRRCVARAGATLTPAGAQLPYFGKPHAVPHPAGDVVNLATGKVAHASIAIVLWHYLLTADGYTGDGAPADRWLTFRELPAGLFYAQAFAVHAEALLAATFGSDPAAFRQAAASLGGQPLTGASGGGLASGASLAPPDAAYRFQAFPRLALAVQLWEGDDEFPGRVQVLFDAAASHYLPTEDLSGVGDWLAHKLKFAR